MIPWLLCGSCARLRGLLLDVQVLHGLLLHLALDLVAVHRGVNGFGLEPPQLAFRHAEGVSGPAAGTHLPPLGADILMADMAMFQHSEDARSRRFDRRSSAAGLPASSEQLAAS